MTQDREGTQAIRSVRRALEILSSFNADKPEWNLLELSEHLGMHKSTIHRLVLSLCDGGFLERNPSTKKYRLTLKLVELGTLVLSQMDLRKEAFPYLQELSDRVGETVHLVVRDGADAIYIEKVERPNAVVRYSRVGKRLPLYCTAVGKVLLAGRPDEEIRSIVSASSPVALTSNTLTDKEALYEHILRVRSWGFATDNEELEYGLQCFAAPIRNHRGEVVAAVSISGSPVRFQGREQELVAAVTETGLSISQRLGFKKGR
ncbi:hypothetical protein SY88_16465 [Clostridiales bacterium PH28_bin88]|nr:hypothetical protein SY88_16465 [Clostridiales bacterium PH28_bin88]